MVKSMTGFGQAQAAKRGERVTVVLKSVNHRYFEASLHLPPSLEHLESVLRNRIRAKVRRGKVYVSINHVNQSRETVLINEALVKKYYRSLNALRGELKLTQPIELGSLITLPGILKNVRQELGLAEREAMVKRALGSALLKLSRMRSREGRALCVDLKSRVERIRRHMRLIKKFVRLSERKRRKLMPPDEWEVFLRSRDVAEEMTRIDFHLNSFLKHLGVQDQKGKVLDFIGQELQREINTLGAKAQDKDIVYQVVMVKDQIEKIREQVQNVE